MTTRGGQAAKPWLDTWGYRMGGGTNMGMMPTLFMLTKQALENSILTTAPRIDFALALITPKLF